MGTNNSQNHFGTKREFDFTSCPAWVNRVHISGLKRTQSDYIQNVASGLYKVKNFQEMIVECASTWGRLNELDIYKNIQIKVDVDKNDTSSKNGYDVTFSGTEYPRVMGAVGTEVGQNEGSMTVQLSAPNIWGRGERLGFHGSYSNSKNTDLCVRLTKPFFHTEFGRYKPNASIGIFRNSTSVPISGYRTQNFGLLSEMKFIYPLELNISHSLQYELSFREIQPINKQSPFFVRMYSGPRMAGLIRYSSSYDRRDNPILPSRGAYIKYTNQICGLGGNVFYLMGDIHSEINYALFSGISIQLATRLGTISTFRNKPQPPISNRFTMGGPLSLRGFQFGGVGPHIDGYAVGIHSYWTTGIHIWTPLPFYSCFGQLGNNFKSHLFYNAGNCNSFRIENLRSAAGFGIALRLGAKARIECNYCYPIHKEKNDRCQSGFQIGIGCEFI